MANENPRFEIFSQGEEVVTGQTVDSNAAWLSSNLVEMGLAVKRHTTVGDDLDDLVELLTEVAGRADCCICTGGLGPTEDDLTAAAVAKAFDAPLQFDEIAFEQIRQHYARRNREMPAINRKQAMLPAGARRLNNDWGTAPGFAFKAGNCQFYFMPGVPYEMRQMFSEQVAPILKIDHAINPRRRVTLRIIGMGESQLQEVVNGLILPQDCALSFRAGPLEVQLKMTFPAATPLSDVRQLARDYADAIGDCVYNIDGLDDGLEGDLPATLNRFLQIEDGSICFAESVSAGDMAGRCSKYNWLRESRVVPSSQHLCAICGLKLEDEHAQTTIEVLAKAMRFQCDTEYALVQLYAGNAQEFDDDTQPARIHIAIASSTSVLYNVFHVNGRAARKRVMAATYSLDLLRRFLSGKSTLVTY